MILVTGAGGTVGGEVLKELLEQGVPVRGAFYTSAKRRGQKPTAWML